MRPRPHPLNLLSFATTTRPHTLRTRQARFQFRASSSTKARFDRVLNRLPRFLRPYTESLRDAPLSNLVAFLVLHEITAIGPLLGLAALFHWSGWLPSFLEEGSYVSEGVSKFGRYFARKGWFGFSKEPVENLGDVAHTADTGEGRIAGEMGQVEKRWHVGEKGSRILVEVATAYAITKILLPLRIIVSVWATPWFARVFVGRVLGSGKSAAARKGATLAKEAGHGPKPP